MPWRRRKQKTDDGGVDLRSRLFELDPATVGLQASPELPNVWGALMEMAARAEASSAAVNMSPWPGRADASSPRWSTNSTGSRPMRAETSRLRASPASGR
jgi:hypothetical protein